MPYNGVVDALWHIVTEERSDLPIRRRSRTRRRQSEAAEGSDADDLFVEKRDGSSWLRNTGIGQLYRGLKMRLGVGIIVFLLAALGGEQDMDGGWAEL